MQVDTNQLLPPTPMTLMGVQLIPTWPVTLPRGTPSRPRRPATAGESTLWTELQHWIGPVLHWLESAPLGAARATAARAAREKSLACIFANVKEEELISGDNLASSLKNIS